MVIWLTGISGAGKTTLSDAIMRRFKPAVPELVQVDGDEVRELFGANLSYAESDRYTQIQRIQRIAQMLDKQNMIVVVSALYGHPDLFAWNRDNFTDYFEVYIEAPLGLVQRRDPKSLYQKAANGEMPNVVGIDIPWHAPTNPHMHINADAETDPDLLAIEIGQNFCKLARRLKGTPESASTVAAVPS